MAVEPTRSQKRTVSCRRSPSAAVPVSEATVAAEPLAGLVQRPAGGADLAEPAAALRTVAPLRAVTMTARRTPNLRRRFHDPPAPGGHEMREVVLHGRWGCQRRTAPRRRPDSLPLTHGRSTCNSRWRPTYRG